MVRIMVNQGENLEMINTGFFDLAKFRMKKSSN